MILTKTCTDTYAEGGDVKSFDSVKVFLSSAVATTKVMKKTAAQSGLFQDGQRVRI